MTLNISQHLICVKRLPDNALCVVNPEEVRIENGLNDTRNDGRGVPESWNLKEISIDPIGYVQGAVCAKSEEVVGGDRFGLASSLQHKELWQNCYRFEPNRKCPQNLRRQSASSRFVPVQAYALL